MTVTNDLNLLLESVRFEINYIDYDPEQYTVPVILTRKRAEELLTDNSIRKVRFTPILGDGSNFTFEPQHLILL